MENIMRTSSVVTIGPKDFRFAVESELLYRAENGPGFVDEWQINLIDDDTNTVIFPLKIGSPISDRDTDGQLVPPTPEYVLAAVAQTVAFLDAIQHLGLLSHTDLEYAVACSKAMEQLHDCYGIEQDQLISTFIDEEQRPVG